MIKEIILKDTPSKIRKAPQQGKTPTADFFGYGRSKRRLFRRPNEYVITTYKSRTGETINIAHLNWSPTKHQVDDIPHLDEPDLEKFYGIKRHKTLIERRKSICKRELRGRSERCWKSQRKTKYKNETS